MKWKKTMVLVWRKWKVRLYFSSQLVLYKLKNTVSLLWIIPRERLRQGGLAEPEEQRLLFNLKSTLKKWMFIIISHFSLDPDNSHIKSRVLPAALTLFFCGLFLFLKNALFPLSLNLCDNPGTVFSLILYKGQTVIALVNLLSSCGRQLFSAKKLKKKKVCCTTCLALAPSLE